MKTLTLGLALSLSLSTFTHMSEAANVKFKAMDDSFASQVCIVAATDGINSARTLVTKQGHSFKEFAASLTCNGKSLRNFSKSWEADKQTETTEKQVKLVVKNNNPESQLCLDALVMGEEAARVKYDAKFENIICNDRTLASFLRQYSNQDVIVASVND